MNNNTFDVVVIGAGFGGMCTAARVASKGYKTLLIERLSFLGGRCSSLDCDGFQLTTGATVIPGGGVIEETFREVGAEFDVRRFQPEMVFRIGGKDYEWPIEKGLANAIYEYSRDKEGAGRVLDAISRALTWELPCNATISLKDWLSQFTDDENIFKVFQPYCVAMIGINIYQLPVSEFFAWASKSLSSGQGPFNYVPKGNAALCEFLGNVIEQKGGQIWKRAEAKRIIVDDHTVRGVVLRTSEGDWEVSAKAVVSNLGPKKTVEITGPQHFDKTYLAEMESIQPTPLMVLVNIVSDEPLIEHQGIVWLIGCSHLLCIISPTICCPELAPPGKHILQSFSGIMEPLSAVDPEREIEMNLAELYKVIPRARKKGKVFSVGCYQRDWPLYRSAWRNLPQRTSVVHLYNVGDGVKIPGLVGVDLCAETARIVTEDIMRRIEPSW